MITIPFLLLLLGSAFIVIFLLGFAQRPPDPIKQAKERYIALARLGRVQGEAELRDRVESLAERYPGKSYLWYLEWLVTDLERAKR
ncbi:MAG: hypothetical protein JNM17_07685 [Archangium sp.]|nr:hypothetical protein [Archangium sp.]